ncbi:unnamed protein product [Symbiodinium natans]|uniref:Uncharacterized protein n=1 Tax=Symbiodinium natans TaxID=878477 RepID=A0A812KVT8_9DINO|nr:unnamed protein product [Symbiodinium natans]
MDFLFGAAPVLPASRPRMFQTSFEQGREEEPPEPGQGGGGTEMVMPFSIKWSAEWKTMQDIHTAEKVAGPLSKLFWLFAGVSVGVGISYLPSMLAQRIVGKKEEEEAAAPPAAPVAKVKAKPKAAPAAASEAPAAAAPA